MCSVCMSSRRGQGTALPSNTTLPEKWIVVTSINRPTPSIEHLASLPGWQVVVVADKKTPLDWAMDGVLLLSVAEQEALPFQTSKLVPWQSYARKNIGYLYAIERGAKVIYETDDDNQLYGGIPMLASPIVMNEYVLSGDVDKAINVYATFGLEHLWPRGFPLDGIRRPVPRVCDIWRGYYSQRLLWEVGAQLVFLPPSVFQHRNPHSLQADFIDEVQLYTDADKLVNFLRDWKPRTLTLPDMAKELAQDMANEKFWDKKMSRLVTAWVAVRPEP
eukprot:jgi/Botrbrau1/16209/Bobra.314_2s0003.1